MCVYVYMNIPPHNHLPEKITLKQLLTENAGGVEHCARGKRESEPGFVCLGRGCNKQGHSIEVSALNEQMVTVTWQTWFKDKFCLILQGHLPSSGQSCLPRATICHTLLTPAQQKKQARALKWSPFKKTANLSTLTAGRTQEWAASSRSSQARRPPKHPHCPSCAEHPAAGSHYSPAQTALRCSPSRALGTILANSWAQNS